MADLSINNTDSIVTSESLSSYSDQVDVHENILIVTDYDPIVSDSITYSESFSHYSDSIDLIENFVLLIPTLLEAVSDSTTLTDSPSHYSDLIIVNDQVALLIAFPRSVSDSIHTSESLTVVIPELNIRIINNFITDENNANLLDENGNILLDENTVELITASDTSNVALAYPLAFADTVTTSESIRMVVFSPNVSDTVTITESLKLTSILNPYALDQPLTSENVLVIANRAGFVFDTVTLSESINFNTDNFITVQDGITASESFGIDSYEPSFLFNDTVGLSENINITYSLPGTAVSDSTTTSESVQISVIFSQTLSVTVSDTVSSSEFSLVFIVVTHADLNITISDTVTTSEARLVIANPHLIIAITFIQVIIPAQINLSLVKRSIH